MSIEWIAGAVLPNISTQKPLEGGAVALVPHDDPRVLDFCNTSPNFKDFLSRFTDAFGVTLYPVVLMVQKAYLSQLGNVNALASFRDIVAASTVPYGRAMASNFPNGGQRISYSNSFWLYPWMVGTDNEHLVLNTPAMNAFHMVEEFHGQSSPEMPEKSLKDVDEPLFEALLVRWKRFYLGKRPHWRDRALFRSLNMVVNAAALPAGIDTTLYDLGRIAALWVSSFEILAHPPKKGKSGLHTVYPMLEKVAYFNPKHSKKRYAAYVNRNKPWPRRTLTCWLYGKLYKARCDFLHGNPVSPKTLNPASLKDSMFWFAPDLYRLALTGFLDLKLKTGDDASHYRRLQYQREIERALWKARK